MGHPWPEEKTRAGDTTMPLAVPFGFEDRKQLKNLDSILVSLRTHYDAPNLDLVRDAYRLAREIHAPFQRKDGGPYIVHPLAVATACADHRMCDVAVASALLHDCIEDADESHGITEEVLASRFGPEVGRIVRGLTKLNASETLSPSAAKEETLKRILSTTASEDIRTIVIKIFDRCDNIQTLQVHSPEAQHRIATETFRFYVPIAARLGFFKEARIMEDHAMRVLQPQTYKIITRWFTDHEKPVRRRVERNVRQIQRQLEEVGIRSRSRFYRKGIFAVFESVPGDGPIDRFLDDGCNFNLSLVVDDVDACFRTLNLVHEVFVHLPLRVRDFIHNPKVNGYQSLHTICTGPDIPKIQILIRTEEMDEASDIGVISQLRAGRIEEQIWLRDLLEAIQEIGGSQILDLTSRVHYAEIDVLTPQGEKRKLRQGATALDFAYEIHTEVGHRAVEAIIDGERRPLRTVLRSDQRVEIVTDVKKAMPTYSWFGWVATDRATVAIRRELNRLEREGIAGETERYLDFIKRALGIALKKDGPEVAALIKCLSFASEREFQRELYSGRLPYDHTIPSLIEVLPENALPKVLKVLYRERLLSGDEKTFAGALKGGNKLRDLLRDLVCEHLQDQHPQELPVVIEGCRFPIPTRLARCCRAEHGDEIVARSSPKGGATIHRRNCRTIRQLVRNWPVQMSRARWEGPPRRRRVRVQVEGKQRQGLITAVTTALSRLKIRIRAVNLTTEANGAVSGNIHLDLPDLVDVSEVQQKLGSVRGITSVREE